MELVTYPTLADSICDTRSRKIKQTFFIQINTLLNWQPIIKVLKQHYRKGKSATGKPSYSGLLLFPLKADKGYPSKKNTELLKQRKLKNHILKKAYKNKPLTDLEKKFNKLIGETRFKVERTFGGIKRWFSGGIARYRGIKKMHSQNLMEAMCYNLYRSPGIIASNCKN